MGSPTGLIVKTLKGGFRKSGFPSLLLNIKVAPTFMKIRKSKRRLKIEWVDIIKPEKETFWKKFIMWFKKSFWDWS